MAPEHFRICYNLPTQNSNLRIWLKGDLYGWLKWFIAIVFVYRNNSWLAYEFKNPLNFAVLFVIGICVYLESRNRNLNLPGMPVLLIGLWPIASSVLALNEGANYLSICYSMLLIFGLAMIPKSVLEEILDKYARFVLLLVVISIGFGCLFLYDYSFVRLFPEFSNPAFCPPSYHNMIIYTERSINDFRSQSIFWEPGAWTFNMAFSAYWIVVKNQKLKLLPVYIVGFLLAFSTTGFALIAILLLYVFVFRTKFWGKFQIILGVLAFVGAMILIGQLLKEKNSIDIFKMIELQTSGKLANPNGNQSFDERMAATKQSMEIANDNPFFGIGRQSESEAIFVTSSISELMYQYGYIYLVMFLLAYFRAFSKFNVIFGLPFVLIMLNGEAYAAGSLTSLLVVFGVNQNTWILLKLKKIICNIRDPRAKLEANL